MQVLRYNNNHWKIISSIKMNTNATNKQMPFRFKTEPLVSIGYKINKAESWGYHLASLTTMPSLKSVEPGKLKALKIAAIIVGIVICLPFILPLRLIGSVLRAVGTAHNPRGIGLAYLEKTYNKMNPYIQTMNSFHEEIKYKLTNEFVGMCSHTKFTLEEHLKSKFRNPNDKDDIYNKAKWIKEFRNKWNAVVLKAIAQECVKKDLVDLNNHIGVDLISGSVLIKQVSNHFSIIENYKQKNEDPMNCLKEDERFLENIQEFIGLLQGFDVNKRCVEQAIENYNNLIKGNIGEPKSKDFRHSF